MAIPSLELPVLLIGGTGRSGSTIFRRVMESHPAVATVPEWRILTDPGGIVEYLTILERGNPAMCDQAYRRLSGVVRDLARSDLISRIVERFVKVEFLNPRRLTRRYASIMAERGLPGFSVAAEAMLERLIEFKWRGQYAGLQFWQSREIAGIVGDVQKAEEVFREFLRTIALMAMEKQKRSRFLEKNTWSLVHFDVVGRLYPTGKLVHIYRDPRDIVASFVGQAWMPSDPVQSARMLKRLIELWWNAREKVDPSRWMEIGLEELVDNTEVVLRQVCEFWEIDFDPCLLSVDLSRANSGRWRTELPQGARSKVEEVLSQVLERYGYS